MSFNPNDPIGLHNYEEWFILYLDNELSATEKASVENFVAQHPQLAEELNMLLSTKLPFDDTSFAGKEELFSAAMKAATVDEALLLYIDNELPSAERITVEKKITASADYALQHSLLLQTKLDAAEAVHHPNKKELYRHTERVVAFKVWMRIAAAVVLLLFGSLFFLLNKNGTGSTVDPAVVTNKPNNNSSNQDNSNPVEKIIPQTVLAKDEEKMLVKTKKEKLNQQAPTQIPSVDRKVKQLPLPSSNETEVVVKEREVIKFDVERFTADAKVDDVVALNNTITHTAVTSALPDRTTDEGPEETAGSDGDFNQTRKTPAKGFFRKVSRFIERRTGIGTVNADNELLIGAVALKLK